MWGVWSLIPSLGTFSVMPMTWDPPWAFGSLREGLPSIVLGTDPFITTCFSDTRLWGEPLWDLPFDSSK